MVKEGALRKKWVRDHEMGPVLGGMKQCRCIQIYGCFEGFPENDLVHCLGWCHIMTPDGLIDSLFRDVNKSVTDYSPKTVEVFGNF